MWRVSGGDGDWFLRIGAYFLRVGDALSQLGNVIIGGGNPNESISGRAWRQRRRFGWKQARIIIDFIFLPFHKGHCQAVARNDVQRARALIADSVEH